MKYKATPEPPLDDLEQHPLKVRWSEETYGAFEGVTLSEVILSIQVVAGAVAGGFLGAIGADLWERMKIKLSRDKQLLEKIDAAHEKASGAAASSLKRLRWFVIIEDHSKTIVARIHGTNEEEPKLYAATQNVATEAAELWSLREDGVFDSRSRDEAINMVFVSIEPDLQVPITEFVAQAIEIPDNGMILDTLFTNIDRETGAKSYRYLGWRTMNLSSASNRLAQAQRQFGKALHLFGFDEPETCHGFAESFYRQGDFANADSWYDRVVGRERDNLSLMINHGICKAQMGESDAAEMLFLRAADKFPSHPRPHYNLGCLYAEDGDFERSIASLRVSVDLGYDNLAKIMNDPNLVSVRQLPEFKELQDRVASRSTDDET